MRLTVLCLSILNYNNILVAVPLIEKKIRVTVNVSSLNDIFVIVFIVVFCFPRLKKILPFLVSLFRDLGGYQNLITLNFRECNGWSLNLNFKHQLRFRNKECEFHL